MLRYSEASGHFAPEAGSFGVPQHDATWPNEFRPELRVEGHSRLTYELEQQGDSVKLTIIHEMDKPDSKLIQAVSGGWPLILASLKSFLETGETLEQTRRWPKGM